MREITFDIGDNLHMAGDLYEPDTVCEPDTGTKKLPIICIPGLTRNAADFEQLAPALNALGHPVLCVSLRGRGRSSHDPNYLNYHPETYRDDVISAIEQMGWREVALIGTSLGGIVSMLINEKAGDLVRTVVLNDVGPEIDPRGMTRIAGYVGKGESFASFDDAARHLEHLNAAIYPRLGADIWPIMAKRTCHENKDGSWSFNYDANISRAIAEIGVAPDLWRAFESTKDTPTLLIRGDLTDLLSEDTIEKMRKLNSCMRRCDVPDVGHTPLLDEPEAFSAIQDILSAA